MMYVSSPKLYMVVFVVLITKDGVSIATLRSAIKVSNSQKWSQSDLIPKGM